MKPELTKDQSEYEKFKAASEKEYCSITEKFNRLSDDYDKLKNVFEKVLQGYLANDNDLKNYYRIRAGITINTEK